MSQASSATFPVSLNGGTPLLIPQRPLFQDFQFKIIGKEPALLMRLSNNMATHVDEFDIDDIYEELPLDSNSMESENDQSDTCSRPTLLQTLAGDDDLGANDRSASMDVANFSSLPASLQSISAPDIPKLLPDTASPLPISHPGKLCISTSSDFPDPAPQCTVGAVGSSTNFERSDRESRTHTTSSSHPSPVDVVHSPTHLRTIDSAKALKKVVILKDKFRAVSTTARQSQRLAKHALMNAQRSAAAAQSCLAVAESFAPCVNDVISAIRRMRPGSGASGAASEWVAVLRDLEDDIYDLKQWSSSDTFALGQDLPHFRSGVTRASSIGFALTSVEEEAQEAVRAWNQLDQLNHENDPPVHNGRPTHKPGSPSEEVAPESHINRPQRPGIENEGGVSQGQETKEKGNRSSEELAGGLEENRGCEQGNSQAGGRQSVEVNVAMPPRVGVEAGVPLDIATEAANAKDLQDDQMQVQEQTAQICEENPYRGFRETMAINTADIASKIIQSFLGSTSTPAGYIPAIPIPQENVSIAPSNLQDQIARNLHAALATPITEDDIEQMTAPASNSVSSADMQAAQLPLALADEVPVIPQHGPNGTPPSQTKPSTPIPTTHGDSDVPCSDGVLGKTVKLPSKNMPEAQTSDRLRDASRTPIKTEFVEPQLNPKIKENKAVGEPVASTELLTKAVEVKSTLNAPLKPDLETPVVSVPVHSSPNVGEIETGSSGRVSSIGLPAPLPSGLPAMKQRPVEPPSSTRPAISDSVKVVTTQRSSPHDVANNAIPAKPADIPNSPMSPSSRASQARSVLVHSPTSPSAVPLALRVEMRTPNPSNTRNFDDSISPDLMSSRGWDADENDGSRRGIKRSPNRFEPIRRSQSRDMESRNQYVDNGSRSEGLPPRSHLPSLGSRLSKSPDGRRPMSSYEYPAPLIGKKRPRDEANHPFPPRGRRDWTGTTFPSVPNNQMSHPPPSQVDTGANPHSKRLGFYTTPTVEPIYNSNNSSRHLGPSLIRRLDPSEPTVGVANPLERRLQYPPLQPQQPLQNQPPQNRSWQNNGYNTGPPSSYSRQSRHGYENDNDQPELLNRMMNSQQFQFQQGHAAFGSGHPHPNVGRPSNRPHGRGRGFGGQGPTFQQQRFSRKPPSLYDRLDNKPY